MANSADPDQLASEDFTVCKDRVYPGSAGQGLNECTLTTRKRREIKKHIVRFSSVEFVQRVVVVIFFLVLSIGADVY